MTAPQQPTKVLGRRGVAWFVDSLISTFLLLFLTISMGETFDRGPDEVGAAFNVTPDEISVETGDTVYVADGGTAVMVYLLVLGWVVLNHVVLTGRTGASVGKHLLGLRVVDEAGAPCGHRKALVRMVLLIVDSLPYAVPLVGLITAAVSSNHQRVGDMVAKTYVVAARDVGREPVGAAHEAWGGAAVTAYGSAPGQSRDGAPPAPQAPVAPTEPQWDQMREAWVRWDGQQWVQHDQVSDTWRPLS